MSAAHKQRCIKLVVVDQYKLTHINVKNVIVFTAVHIKYYYDKAYQFQFFNISDAVNLWLHYNYILLRIQNKKLNQQFVEFLLVKKCIEQLVYWFNLLNTWRIHDIVLIAHLKSIYINNLYQCSQSDHSVIIVTLSDTESEWKTKWLIWKWMYQKRHRYTTEYLMH